MNLLSRLFGSTPPEPLPPDTNQEVATETLEIDFETTLPAAWGTFVQNFVGLYGMPSLVQSQGPGRTTAFNTLSEDGESISRLTDPDVLREMASEWKTQLNTAPTPRALVVELDQAEGFDRPSILFLYPTAAELTPSFSEWASNRAQLDSKRDKANRGVAQQGVVIFARLTKAAATGGDDGSVWLNELARQKVAAKAHQSDGDGARVVEEVEEITPETSKTPKKKPSNPLQR